MNDYDEAHLYDGVDDEGVAICEACCNIVDEDDLEWDEDSTMYVCVECRENPPDDF